MNSVMGVTPDSRPASAGDLTALRLLVVDDSQSVRQLIVDKLAELARGEYALGIEQAFTGEEAVLRGQQEHFDLIFLDVEMPGMGGIAACRVLREQHQGRIVMLSARKSAEAHLAGRQAGCDNYMTKPPHDADLRSVLRLTAMRKATLS